ncbi:protein ABHD14B-like [Limulus polyphemus]|uniref:Protein ABHD14B-like n=1 Tax=Limulus polyphemus TaxID=6850 RepID=A0ABM1SIX3_LIMPO|nr:protein ABHD14B-like [Limulus polyphemus]XP_022243578.1 protein ABHD14B-like [Limulus polyphemus]XP_022243579.1 protein ABHD14B-like [Limulus polyphemus]
MTSRLSMILLLACLTCRPCEAESASIQQFSDQTKDITTSDFWRHVDLKSQEIPEEITQKAADIDVKETSITIDDVNVFYREALPKGSSNSHISILLLHGAAFSSETWLNLGTIQMLAAMGYRTVAIDIPGFGNSRRKRIPERGEFINDIVKALNLIRPVVVSPSMSGAFALPYLLKHSTDMGGYVPVAPGATSVLERQPCGSDQSKEMPLDSVCESLKNYFSLPFHDLSCLKTPTMVVFGEYDRGKNSAVLCLLPRSQGVEIPKGNHPAYLTNPGLWHKLLYNFLHYADQLAAKTQ